MQSQLARRALGKVSIIVLLLNLLLEFEAMINHISILNYRSALN